MLVMLPFQNDALPIYHVLEAQLPSKQKSPSNMFHDREEVLPEPESRPGICYVQQYGTGCA